MKLLQRSADVLRERHAEAVAVELATTKATYEAYRVLHDKLQDIVRAFIEARFPKAQSVYLTRWHFYADRHEGSPDQIVLDMEYRRYEVEDGEDEDRPDGYDGTGAGYVQRKFTVYAKPEWLWDPTGFRAAVKRAGIEHELEVARKREAGLASAIPTAHEHVDDLIKRRDETVAHRMKLERQLAEGDA